MVPSLAEPSHQSRKAGLVTVHFFGLCIDGDEAGTVLWVSGTPGLKAKPCLTSFLSCTLSPLSPMQQAPKTEQPAETSGQPGRMASQRLCPGLV